MTGGSEVGAHTARFGKESREKNYPMRYDENESEVTSMIGEDRIVIRGLRQNNLKNVSLDIPKGKIVVFTGVSGSGKSSIVFDMSSCGRFSGWMHKPPAAQNA